MVLVKTFPAAGLPALVSVKPLLESTPIVKVDTSAAALNAKTLTRYVIPAIILKYHNKVVHSFDMTELNKEPDKVLAKHLIAIDDIGTEDISIRFGEKRSVVPEILDAAEKYGKLLLLTSNLGGEDLIKKYGNRTFDRILAVTKRIEFNGKSFRE